MGAHIQLSGVGHRYKVWRDLVLKDVTLDFRPGERIAVLGRSGCGKSTLLQIVAGLLLPSEGSVRIDGAKITGPSPKWNLMFQRPLLFPWLNAAQNVALGLRFAGKANEGLVRAESLLKQVGLQDFVFSKVTELSGGQQQRVALARSLATDPQALLLDEPFSALDAVTRTSLRSEVQTLAAKLGLTLVLVTHDVGDALELAERIVVLAPSPGRVVGDFQVSESKDRSALRARLIELIAANGTDATNEVAATAA